MHVRWGIPMTHRGGKPIAMQYIVLCGQVVGSGPFVTVYNFDGQRFDNREDAIQHGFTLDRSDDFNIGVLRNGKLVSLDWMVQTVDSEPALMAKISEGIYL